MLEQALDAAFLIVMPLWLIVALAAVIFEIRRIWLLIQLHRGQKSIEDMPPLRSELPDVSMRTILTDRLKR